MNIFETEQIELVNNLIFEIKTNFKLVKDNLSNYEFSRNKQRKEDFLDICLFVDCLSTFEDFQAKTWYFETNYNHNLVVAYDKLSCGLRVSKKVETLQDFEMFLKGLLNTILFTIKEPHLFIPSTIIH